MAEQKQKKQKKNKWEDEIIVYEFIENLPPQKRRRIFYRVGNIMVEVSLEELKMLIKKEKGK